ncbi:STAS domain-containing protein [Actinoplanes sp. NPDC024001]|uniref:STAS domain-containing protein n=1 Tax=Actinoplanes sp. NPDC024001 TaxID=3154598 RepID=UPI0033D34D70
MRDSWDYVLDAAPPRISVTCGRLPSGDWLVRVHGELETFTAPTLRRHLNTPLSSGEGLIDLDLGGLVFCDHAGLRALLAIEAEAEPGRVRIVAVHPCVDLVMRLCGVNVLFQHRHSA